MDIIKTNRDLAAEWFFNGGYKQLDKLEQVAYLIDECGYTESGAWELVYGNEF